MTDNEQELVNKLYEEIHHLWSNQGDEIAALKEANRSLAKSHEVIGRMLEIISKLIRTN